MTQNLTTCSLKSKLQVTKVRKLSDEPFGQYNRFSKVLKRWFYDDELKTAGKFENMDGDYFLENFKI